MATATIDAPAESQPTRGPARRSVLLDVALALGLFTIALLYRRHFPPDGLFYDDAWQAFGAAEGGLRQFITVGQTQPGFGLELMAWARIFGSGASTMVLPAMIAGALGPAALYLVLRRFGYAVSIAFLLGAALTVCETAITYSGRVKSYTSDVLVILLLCVLVPWLARKRWGVAIAAAWFVGSVALASFSSFALLATIAAAAIFVFRAQGDRKVRLVSAGAQAVALFVLVAAEDRTHNDFAEFFKPSEGYIEFHANPVTFGSEIIKHLVRVTDVFPGGPGWFTVVCMVAATAGLIAMARRGSTAVLGRFLVLMVVLAMVGSLVERVPFGPMRATARVTLWLTPVVAFGLAVVLQRLYRAAVAGGTRTRLAFDITAFGLSALVLVSAIGATRMYPSGAAQATHFVMERADENDAVIITRPTLYTFALEADTPVRLRPTPDLTVGFLPRFDDERLVPVDLLTAGAKREVESAVQRADRVFVVNSLADAGGYKSYRDAIAGAIEGQGFKLRFNSKIGTARVSVWQRQGTGQSAG